MYDGYICMRTIKVSIGKIKQIYFIINLKIMNKNLQKYFANVWSQEKKQIAIDILNFIHNTFLSNQIDYSLIAGSLLGYARHNDIIPWDDDIDIGIMKTDEAKMVRLTQYFKQMAIHFIG